MCVKARKKTVRKQGSFFLDMKKPSENRFPSSGLDTGDEENLSRTFERQDFVCKVLRLRIWLADLHGSFIDGTCNAFYTVPGCCRIRHVSQFCRQC